MAVTNEFIAQVAEALEALGAKAIENDTDIPYITSKQEILDNPNNFSLPMVGVVNAQEAYKKVKIDVLIDAACDQMVAENDMMEALTQEQFNAIFYPTNSSSE